jgi:hypothetical protein
MLHQAVQSAPLHADLHVPCLDGACMCVGCTHQAALHAADALPDVTQPLSSEFGAAFYGPKRTSAL